MKDYQASFERLRKEASDYAVLRDQATEQTKWQMYNLLVQHLTRLADEVEKAMGKMSERKNAD